MRLGTGLDPRAEERLRRVSSSGGDEFVSRLTEGPVRTESDRPKADVEPLVLDDLVGAAVLGGGVGATVCEARLNMETEVSPVTPNGMWFSGSVQRAPSSQSVVRPI